MSVFDTTFATPQEEDFAIGAAIRAEPWRALLQNQNHLFRLASGETILGGGSTTPGHDHADGGGPALTRTLCIPWGVAASPVYGAERTQLEVTGAFSSSETSERLSRWPLEGPSVSSPAAAGAFTLFLAQDWAETVMSYGYLVAQPSANRERLLVKKARYESESNRTRVTLWDPLAAPLATGTPLRLYRCNGTPQLPLFVPSWANTLKVYLRACCSVSLEESASGAPVFYEFGTQGALSWLYELSLTSGERQSAAIRLYPEKTLTLGWCALSLSLEDFEKNRTQLFGLSFAQNPNFSILSPIVYHPRDLSLWLRSPQDAPSPIIAVLSSAKGA